MKKIIISLFLIYTTNILTISAQNEYDCSKYYGTWVYENQDTVFTVQFGETTIYTDYGEYRLIVGNYKLSVKGKMVYDYLKTIPPVIDERGKQNQPDSFYGIYLRYSLRVGEDQTKGKLLGIIDPIKKYNNGKKVNSLRIKLLPDGRLKWTLTDYDQVRIHFPEMYENPDEPFTGYSMPTHAIFRKVE